MYEPHKKEDNSALTPEKLEEMLLKEELNRIMSMYPDFSATEVKIDDIIPHNELDKYDPKTVVKVAAEHNFIIQSCTCTETHQQPKLRANGKWIDPPKNLEWEKIADETMCELCGEATRAKLKKLYNTGGRVQPTYKSMRLITEHY